MYKLECAHDDTHAHIHMLVCAFMRTHAGWNADGHAQSQSHVVKMAREAGSQNVVRGARKAFRPDGNQRSGAARGVTGLLIGIPSSASIPGMRRPSPWLSTPSRGGRVACNEPSPATLTCSSAAPQLSALSPSQADLPYALTCVSQEKMGRRGRGGGGGDLMFM